MEKNNQVKPTKQMSEANISTNQPPIVPLKLPSGRIVNMLSSNNNGNLDVNCSSGKDNDLLWDIFTRTPDMLKHVPSSSHQIPLSFSKPSPVSESYNAELHKYLSRCRKICDHLKIIQNAIIKCLNEEHLDSGDCSYLKRGYKKLEKRLISVTFEITEIVS